MYRIVLTIGALVPLVGCPQPKCVPSGPCSGGAIEDVRVESDRIVVELTAGETRYRQTCSTEVLSLAAQEGSGGIIPLATDHEDVADRWEGYWLNGEFLYPALDEGCDVVECIEIVDDPEIGRIHFFVTGTDVPPDDLQDYLTEYGWGQEAAEMVSVVESAPIEGKVELSLRYHLAADCHDIESMDTYQIDL